MKYFENFPIINYDNINVQNLMLRIRLLEDSKQQSTIYYPYVIKDGEKAESIAFDYYDSTDYVWIIYLVNNIIDPYYDWPLSSVQFDRYIAKKYESSPGLNDGINVAKSTIVGYKQIPVTYYINQLTNVVLTSNAYVSSSVSDPYNWLPVVQDNNIILSANSTYDPTQYNSLDLYTKELDKNEKKKFIRLLDKTYTLDISKQLKSLLVQ
jgi:hypothetical protein